MQIEVSVADWLRWRKGRHDTACALQVCTSGPSLGRFGRGRWSCIWITTVGRINCNLTRPFRFCNVNRNVYARPMQRWIYNLGFDCTPVWKTRGIWNNKKGAGSYFRPWWCDINTTNAPSIFLVQYCHTILLLCAILEKCTGWSKCWTTDASLSNAIRLPWPLHTAISNITSFWTLNIYLYSEYSPLLHVDRVCHPQRRILPMTWCLFELQNFLTLARLKTRDLMTLTLHCHVTHL